MAQPDVKALKRAAWRLFVLTFPDPEAAASSPEWAALQAEIEQLAKEPDAAAAFAKGTPLAQQAFQEVTTTKVPTAVVPSTTATPAPAAAPTTRAGQDIFAAVLAAFGQNQTEDEDKLPLAPTTRALSELRKVLSDNNIDPDQLSEAELQELYARASLRYADALVNREIPSTMNFLKAMTTERFRSESGTFLGQEVMQAAEDVAGPLRGTRNLGPVVNVLALLAGIQAEVEEMRQEEAKAKTPVVAQRLRQAQDKAQEDDLGDALKEMEARFPKSKAFLRQLKPLFLEQFRSAQAGQMTEAKGFGALGDVGAAAGLTGGTGSMATGPGAWVRGNLIPNLDTFMEDNGFGEQWQGLQFRDAFDLNVAGPMRAGAKTAEEKLAVETQIKKLEDTAGPALQQQYQLWRKENPGTTSDAEGIEIPNYSRFFRTDNAKGILGEATRQAQTRIKPGDELAGRQRRQQEAAKAYDWALKGYSPKEIADELNITEADAATLSQQGAKLRQFYVGKATLSLGGPAGEVRGGEFGQDVSTQYVQNPVTGEQIAERNAALDTLTGGEFSRLSREQTIREAGQFNLAAQALERDNRVRTLKYKIGQLTGGIYDEASNEQELTRLLGQMEAAPDLYGPGRAREVGMGRAHPGETVAQALQDKDFLPVLTRLASQHAQRFPEMNLSLERFAQGNATQLARIYEDFSTKRLETEKTGRTERITELDTMLAGARTREEQETIRAEREKLKAAPLESEKAVTTAQAAVKKKKEEDIANIGQVDVPSGGWG